MGSLDVPATALGLSHARKLRIDLDEYDHLVTSPLRRASDTLEALAPNRPTGVDPRLAERRLGVWEGMSRARVAAQYPDFFLADDVMDATKTPPAGEPFAAFVERVESVLREAERSDKSLLVVTHNGWIRTARYVLGEISCESIFAESEPHLVPVRLALTAVRED